VKRATWPEAAGFVAAAMAALAPLWNTYLVPQLAALTVGRLFIVALAATVVAGLWGRRTVRLPAGSGCVALGALVCAGMLVAGSAATSGCTCDGAVYGFGEYVAVSILTAIAVMLAPRMAPIILVGIGVGAVMMALLALVGVDALHSSVGPPAVSLSNRLTGPLGNSNLLGMYLSLALPLLALVTLRRRG